MHIVALNHDGQAGKGSSMTVSKKITNAFLVKLYFELHAHPRSVIKGILQLLLKSVSKDNMAFVAVCYTF